MSGESEVYFFVRDSRFQLSPFVPLNHASTLTDIRAKWKTA